MRSFPLIRAGKPAILMSCLLTIPILLMAFLPLAGLSGVTPLLLAYAFYPCLLCIAGLWGGALPMGLGLLSAVGAMFVSFGERGALLMLLYLLPFVAAFVVLVEKKVKFFLSAGIMMGVLLLCQAGALIALGSLSGGSVARAAGEGMATLVQQSPQCDELLLAFYQTGLIPVKDSLRDTLFTAVGNGYYALSAAGRQEMLLSVASFVEDVMSGLPSMMLTTSIYSAIGGLGLSLYIGRISVQRSAYRAQRKKEVALAIEQRREAIAQGKTPEKPTLESPADFRIRLEKAEQETPEGFPDLQMPPLSKWCLPRGWGLKIGILSIGYVIFMFSENAAARTIGQMFYAIFSAVYTVQGVAALNFLQKKAGVRVNGRRATPIIIFIIFQMLLQWIGVLDQILNFRALRPPLGQNLNREE